MNQIEQLEEQGCTLLDERNAAIREAGILQKNLEESETELNTAKAWYESTWEGGSSSVPSPALVQNSVASTKNVGPNMTVDQWKPLPHEEKFFGASRMFPGPSSSSVPSPKAAASAPSQSSSAPAAAPAPAAISPSDIELHHRAVMANPLEYGGSGVERMRGVEKDFAMLKAARDKGLMPKDPNSYSGCGGKRKGTPQGANVMPAEFMASATVPAWRQQLQLDTSAQVASSASEWPPQEWGEDRRAATARAGPDREPEPPVQGTPVKILVSGLDTLKVGKKSRKKGTPSKSKRKVKRSASPAAKRVGSSDAIMESAEAAASTEGKEEAGL